MAWKRALESRGNLRETSRGARLCAILVATGAVLGCDTTDPPVEPVDDTLSVSLELVADGLQQPLFLTSPPEDADRLFVVERGGAIRIVRNDVVAPEPFLDISGRVATEGEEQGLLGMAFHPQYAANGFFYVSYTRTDGDVRIERYSVSANADSADEASAFPILTVPHANPNHNGGMLAFGPDGMLYIGLGDGGTGSSQTGQDFGSLLASILRIDVDGGSPYVVPADNPFATHATNRHELWAKGLRNPWRFAFDRANGDLIIADVGEAMREEIDFQPASSGGGENYGWHVMEAGECYEPASGCSPTGLVLPILDYDHSRGCSITGGYVYRGSAYPDLVGRYFYSDFCASWLRSFEIANGVPADDRDHGDAAGPLSGVSSFGEDADGELYVLSMFAGTVHRIVSP